VKYSELKTINKMKLKIIESGPQNFKNSKTYSDKVKAIKEEIKTNYKPLLDNEPDFIRRIILKLKMVIEIRRAISKLNSSEKMYLQIR
jgi:hypothetical protein